MATPRSRHRAQPGLAVDRSGLEAHLRRLGFEGALIVAMEPLGKVGASIKGLGYGEPVRVVFRDATGDRSVVLRTVAASGYGHDRRSDRAAEVLLSFDTFGTLPAHVRAIDVGFLGSDGTPLSVRECGEPFLVTEYAEGRLYAEDLAEIGRRGAVVPLDLQRVDTLASYAAHLHREKIDDARVYVRAVRDLVGHGEGVFGITDGYPSLASDGGPSAASGVVASDGGIGVERLEAIEHRLLAWRWKLKRHVHRCRATHGDFHPFNVLFREGVDLTLLDRSRGGRGDPADDVACMTINYLFFGLRFPSAFREGYGRLWSRFWRRYLAETGDHEMLAVIAPFYAWRALVVASPAWYPDLDTSVRDRLLRFAEDALDAERLDPDRIEAEFGARSPLTPTRSPSGERGPGPEFAFRASHAPQPKPPGRKAKFVARSPLTPTLSPSGERGPGPEFAQRPIDARPLSPRRGERQGEGPGRERGELGPRQPARGSVVWLTGRPASGKTTIARALHRELAASAVASCVLDGDELRPVLVPDAGYDAPGRAAFYGALASLAWVLAEQGLVVLVAATAPSRAHRDVLRARAQASRSDGAESGPRFVEVHVACDEGVCASRDPKGLYAAARRGEVSTLPGAQVAYEAPLHPELTVDTSNASVQDTVAAVRRALAITRT
ncbi:MAG: adenylyl-sulfate kinase [Deltaproteobacteria bacterium]|nr:adenylyl-sulfate kinase [Deltaproteobacteria bacterium]